MNYAYHRIIEAVIRHSCTEIRLYPSQCTEVCSELAFVAGITRIILTKDMTSGMRDQSFCSF